MADGNTGDTTAQPLDHKVGTPAPAATDKVNANVNDNLHNDAHSKPGDKVATSDSTQTSDQVLDKVKETTEKPAVDSYTHLTNAQQAANEIAGYVKAGKKETDTVTFNGPDGKPVTEKVADRVAELKKVVDTECATAVGQSNNIKQADVTQLLQAARNDRNALAKEMHLDPNKLSKTAIADLRKHADGGDAAKLDKLALMQSKVDTFKLWENAPAYTRMLYSSFKAAGLTDPKTGMEKDPNGGLKASQKDVLDAVQLLSEAGSNKDLRNSRLYVEAVATVLPKLENSSTKVQTITTDLENATKAGAKGDKVEQERLLKDAVTQADQTNTAAIAQMLRDPRFVQSQRDQTVISDMANNVVMSSTARLAYAQFLTDQGKYGDAQGLVLRVKTECPEVMYGHDPKDPTKFSYNQSRFVDLAKLDMTVAVSSAVQPNQVKNILDDFDKAMTDGVVTTTNGRKGAHELLNDAFTAVNKKAADIADGQKGLDQAQKELDQRKTELAAKTYLTDDSKKLEQNQIDREQLMIQQQKAILEGDAKDATHLQNVVKLYDAKLDVAEENRSAARARLAEIKASDPSMCAATGPDGKDTLYGALEKGAVEPGWWDRNWRKVATVGAVVAGAVVGLATFWSGPGAILCGAGTTAALMTSMGVAVGAGALAGGVTFLGTHEALYQTGVVKEKVNVGDDFVQGLAKGAMGSFMAVSLPAMAGVGAIAGTGAAVEGTALATGAAVETTAVATGAAIEGTGVAVGTGTTVAVEGTAAATSTATTAAQGLTWAGRAWRLGAVSFSGAAPMNALDQWSLDPEDRSWKSFGQQTLFMTGAPMLGPAGGAGLRYLGIMKAAPEVASLVSATPKVWTLGNGFMAAGGSAFMLAIPGYAAWAKADALGPNYAYGENGGVGPISRETSPFGPQNNTRGLEDGRQQKGKNAAEGQMVGERSLIETNWGGLPEVTSFDLRKMAGEKNPTPPTNHNSDFSDAADLIMPPKQP